MIAQLCLTSCLQMSLVGVTPSPQEQAITKIINNPGDNMTVIIIVAAVIVALVVGIFYLIKKQYDQPAV